MKFNVALVPKSDMEQFIRYAEVLSANAPADRYHIGGDASIPHVSLCHFECEPANIDEVWEEIENLDISDLRLRFEHHRSRTYPDNPKDAGVSWVSLVPDHLESLKDLHLQVADIIKKPLNGAFANYDPHMTLFNSKRDEQCAQLNIDTRLIEPLEDDFSVVIGTIDNVGQITQITHSNLANYSSMRP